MVENVPRLGVSGFIGLRGFPRPRASVRSSSALGVDAFDRICCNTLLLWAGGWLASARHRETVGWPAGSAATCSDLCSRVRSTRSIVVAPLTRTSYSLAKRRMDGALLRVAVPTRVAAYHGAKIFNSGIFHTRSDPRRERSNIAFHSQPLSLTIFRRSHAPCSRRHRQRLHLHQTSRAANTVLLRSLRAISAVASIAANIIFVPRGRRAKSSARRDPHQRRRLMNQPALKPLSSRNNISARSLGRDDDARWRSRLLTMQTPTIFQTPVVTAKMGAASIPGPSSTNGLRFHGLAGGLRRRLSPRWMATITSGRHNTSDAGDDLLKRCRR